MLAKRRRQVSEHRVRAAGDRHQVGRRGALDDPGRELPERVRGDPHVKRAADIETHRQAVELRHDGVFQARALELLGRPEDFRADEARHVVDDRPRACLLADVPRDAVRPASSVTMSTPPAASLVTSEPWPVSK